MCKRVFYISAQSVLIRADGRYLLYTYISVAAFLIITNEEREFVKMLIYLSMLETENDRAKYEEFYKRNRQKLYAKAYKSLNHHEDAEDAVHQGFLNVAEKFEDYRMLSDVELDRLCMTVVKNCAFDILRERKQRGRFDDETGHGEDDIPDCKEDVLDMLTRDLDRGLITQKIMELREEDRGLVYLYVYKGMKLKQIAKLWGKSEESIRVRWHRCKKKLAKLLEVEKNAL